MPSSSSGFNCLIFAVIAGLWSSGLFPRIQGKPVQVKPGCRYEGRRYQEGAIVTTSEPCLQCHCVDASLRCRLRVCPRIPNPPPPECHLRISSEHVCCSEMICGESQYEDENLLRRMDIAIDDVIEQDGCLFEGVRYGAGSAMIATRRCEYCYCILGARRCVRPKCLLPLPGCLPLYAPHSCCPVAYNCTHDQDEKTSTTTLSVSLTGCRVGNRVYNEGEMVRDIAWKAPCDNCFCAMGAVRCVPLSCAPPLQGCIPIVREGQCCPSTYNCSGSIEVKGSQNYASYAFVSKDYANFRKETHFYPVENQMNAIMSNAIVEGRGHRIIDGIGYTTDHEINDVTTIRSGAFDSTSSSTMGDLSSTIETETMGNEIFSETTAEPIRSTDFQLSTTFTTPLSTEVTTDSEVPTSPRELTTLETSTYEFTTTLTLEESMSAEVTSTTIESTSTTIDGYPVKEKLKGMVHEDEARTTERTALSTVELSNSGETRNKPTLQVTHEQHPHDTRVKIIDQKLITSTRESVTSLPTTVLMADDIFVMNVTLKTNVSVGHVEGVTITPVRSIAPDVEAILNITQREKGEDYDYYSEPTLPPSLPNVRIIPFVAADALVNNEKDATSSVTAYPSGSAGILPELQRPTDSSNYYDIVTRENRFSPPVETEGGFVPRDPPYFEPSYHSTDLSLEIGTGVTVVPADITNPKRKEDGLMTDCRFETRQYHHGEFIPNSGLCIICMCYYGEVVCSDEKCPPLKIGCRRVNDDDGCCGKIICIDTAESPTMVLDRADATAPSQRQPVTSSDGIVTPDPFRDVIKTEPAPDLPSLIEDMIPYLVERGISTPRPTTPMSNGIKSNSGNQNVNFKPEFVPDIHSPLYSYRDQINRRQDEGVVVTGTSISATNEGSYNFGTNFQTFSQNTDNKNSEYKNDDEFSEFPYEKVTPDKIITSDTAVKNLTNLGFELKNTSGSVNHSVHDKQMDYVSKLNPVTTEIVSIISEVEKTEANLSQEELNDKEDSLFSFDHVLDVLFSGITTGKPVARIPVKEIDSSTSTTTSTRSSVTTDSSTSTTVKTSSTSLKVSNSTAVESPTTRPIKSTTSKPTPTIVGSLLKLAGCNIYGRMYRVGRIITELSGPCLECRCTEIGVQCKKLSCL